MSANTVLHSLAISQVMLNFAAEHGVAGETCLAGTGITPAMLQDPEALIGADQELRLIENLMLALPDRPAAGFELGLRYQLATFGTWGFALRTSRDLREAVERALRYLPLSTAYCVFSTATTGGEFAIRADPANIPVHLRRFLLERDLATAVNLVRELKLSGQPVQRLEFAGPPPAHAEHLRELAGAPPAFHARTNALVLRLDDATTPLPTFDAHLVRLLEDQCRQLLARRQTGGVSGQVREALLGRLGLVASLEEVARALNLSARSLRRRLDAEGESFRGLVEELRRQLAEQLLTGTAMTLDELALQLGYADTASFTRAFRRWHGVSPGRFRAERAAIGAERGTSDSR